MKVLCLQPHPDDVIISCGGTLLLHQQQEDEVLIFSFTKGERAGKNRDKELEGMVKDLKGVHTWNQEWGNGDYPFSDGEIPATAPEKFREIDKRINEYNPDIVYLPYPQDTHPDHANAAQHGLALTRNCSKTLLYENFSAQAFDGTVFVDIRHVWNGKKNLLKQFKEHPIPIDVVEAMARFRAVQGRLTLWFSIDSTFQDELDNGTISNKLREVFKKKEFSLSQNAVISIEEKGKEWLITDKDNRYIVEKKVDKLNVRPQAFAEAFAPVRYLVS